MKYFVLIFSISLSLAVHAQERKSVWDYPVKPGTPEWASFTTGRQKWEACQIPQKVLDALSTKDLAEICLNFPLFFEYTVLNDERKGISLMIEKFSGLKELSKRKGGALELMGIYKNFPVLSQIQDKASKDYDTPYKLPFLELLLSDNAFIHQLGDQQIVELEKLVLEKYVGKLEKSHIYCLYNIQNTFLLGAVVINKKNETAKAPQHQDIVKRFIANFRNADPLLLTEISKIISGL